MDLSPFTVMMRFEKDTIIGEGKKEGVRGINVIRFFFSFLFSGHGYNVNGSSSSSSRRSSSSGKI